jgi:hydrogenase expression/formation protein HypC
MCLAIPGEIIAIDASDPTNPQGLIDFGGVRRSVCLAYLPEARLGDYVLIHAGFALSVLDEAEARATLAAFRELDSIR